VYTGVHLEEEEEDQDPKKVFGSYLQYDTGAKLIMNFFCE
jgi:hypothetical protein